jgi:hypothetical protein
VRPLRTGPDPYGDNRTTFCVLDTLLLLATARPFGCDIAVFHTRSLDQRVRRATTRPYIHSGEHEVAKKTKRKRKEYTEDDVKLLKAHSKARTPVVKLSKLMKRSEGSLRQKARAMGIGLGHQR